MSMLSAQCDELRWLAEHLDERERGMDEYVTALRNAADTIWELRGSVHREREEADKLRELARDYDKCLDTALWLAGEAGYPVMPNQKLFNSLRPRMRELGIEAD